MQKIKLSNNIMKNSVIDLENKCKQLSLDNGIFSENKQKDSQSIKNKEKKLAILVDGSSFIYRAFYALPQLTNKKNEPVGAVYGFCSMILSILDKQQSDLFCVALDAGRNTFRKKIYNEYKNNREETPADLKAQFPLLLKACQSFGLPIVEIEGYEADDIIATYSSELANNNYEVRIVASDKDLMQLINENTYLFDPIKSKIIKKEEVFEKYGVYPEQMVMLQSLMGDKTDNVPGIDGIGPKTAAKLVNEFKTIDCIYKNIEKITPIRIREKLRDNYEALLLSEKLVTLSRNVPISKNFSNLKVSMNIDNAISFLEEQNFRSLVKRLKNFNERKEKQQRKHIYIKNLDDLHNFLEFNRPRKISLFSTPCFNGGQVLVICTESQIAECFFSISDETQINKNTLSLTSIISVLRPYFQDLSITKIGTRQILKLFGSIEAFQDIISISYLLYGVTGDKLSSIFRENDSYICKFAFSEICNPEQAGLVAELFYDEFENMYSELNKSNLIEIYKKIDMPLIYVLNQMEINGVMVSASKLKEVSDVIDTKIEETEYQIFEIVGYKFNIASTKQLAEVLFNSLHIPKQKNKTSLDVESLEELYDFSPVPKLVVEWRKLSKLASTYVTPLFKLIDSNTQRVHTTFHSTSTITGRLSSSNPNLQNIPYRSELGKKIRSAFISSEGYKLVSFDYSQIELRVLAHLADIKLLKEAFSLDRDVHTITAANIFKVSESMVTPEMRSKAKTVNFGIIYGMSPFRLSKSLNIPLDEAKQYIENYFNSFPEFHNFKEKC